MLINFCETEALRHLALFDFLDVCLLGETGTGKTFAARRIHEMSSRAGNPFIAVNCAELTPALIESELFGHEKGAFTGAVGTKIGKFEAASSGTIFLDEIAELPENLQAKLLKVVEEKCVTRVGGTRPRSVDIRIIYATHRDLSILREDFRYRVAAHTVRLKPLRERRGEIVSFARYFLSEFSNRCGRSITATDETLKLLENAEWHGNVRELRSFVEKVSLDALFRALDCSNSPDAAVQLSPEHLLEALLALTKPSSYLPAPMQKTLYLPVGETMDEYLERIEKGLLKTALDAHNNNKARAARHLGISRSGLIKKLKRIGH